MHRPKYRAPELRSELQWWSLEFGEQFSGRVGPFDRCGMRIEVGKISGQITFQGAETREIMGREEVALDFAKEELDLIEPAGVFGEPVPTDLKGQLQRRQPRAQLFGGVGRAVVKQMPDFAPGPERAL